MNILPFRKHRPIVHRVLLDVINQVQRLLIPFDVQIQVDRQDTLLKSDVSLQLSLHLRVDDRILKVDQDLEGVTVQRCRKVLSELVFILLYFLEDLSEVLVNYFESCLDAPCWPRLLVRKLVQVVLAHDLDLLWFGDGLRCLVRNYFGFLILDRRLTRDVGSFREKLEFKFHHKLDENLLGYFFFQV